MRGSDQKLRRPGESLLVIPINQEKELPTPPPVNENEKEHPPLPSRDKDWLNVATLVNEWERFAATMSDYLRTLAGSAERITHALPPPAGEPERLLRISELTEAVALLNEGSFPTASYGSSCSAWRPVGLIRWPMPGSRRSVERGGAQSQGTFDADRAAVDGAANASFPYSFQAQNTLLTPPRPMNSCAMPVSRR